MTFRGTAFESMALSHTRLGITRQSSAAGRFNFSARAAAVAALHRRVAGAGDEPLVAAWPAAGRGQSGGAAAAAAADAFLGSSPRAWTMRIGRQNPGETLVVRARALALPVWRLLCLSLTLHSSSTVWRAA